MATNPAEEPARLRPRQETNETRVASEVCPPTSPPPAFTRLRHRLQRRWFKTRPHFLSLMHGEAAACAVPPPRQPAGAGTGREPERQRRVVAHADGDQKNAVFIKLASASSGSLCDPRHLRSGRCHADPNAVVREACLLFRRTAPPILVPPWSTFPSDASRPSCGNNHSP